MSAAVQDFITAMQAAGVIPAEPVAGKLLGGKLVRFRCEGDGGKRNGWAVFLPVVPGLRTRARGRFGNYKMNTGTIEWWEASDAAPMSPADRARLRDMIEAESVKRARETEQAQANARAEAGRIWYGADPASPDHPYAAAKRMGVEGLRQRGDVLLVPMCDAGGSLWNIQRIFPDGSKRFLKGGRIIGLFTVIGWRPAFARGVFAEGYATGDAVAQALASAGAARPVVVAFNTANLAPVVAGWVRLYPCADWVIAADDDHLSGLRMVERGQPYQNPGIDKASEVAAAYGCRVAYPPSVLARPMEGDPRNIDFSDMLLAGDAILIERAVSAARRPANCAQPGLAERIGRALA